MKIQSGIIAGAGTSALYIGLGYIPAAVRLFQNTANSAVHAALEWNKHMQRSTGPSTGNVGQAIQGIIRTTNTDSDWPVQTAAGVSPYFGGDAITTASANYVLPIQHSAFDDAFGINKYAVDQRDRHTGGTVTKYTQGSTVRGYFNAPVDTTYVGIGSRVIIQPDGPKAPREYFISHLANDGDAANDITLNAAAPSGQVVFIGYKYDFAQAPAGVIMPVGIAINDTTYLNVSGQIILAEFIQW
jgi:hypothetical protein